MVWINFDKERTEMKLIGSKVLFPEEYSFKAIATSKPLINWEKTKFVKGLVLDKFVVENKMNLVIYTNSNDYLFVREIGHCKLIESDNKDE